MTKKTVAAIDLGTNSCRLLIADLNGKSLYKNAISTRMGEGMSLANRFTPEAITRGIECFCTFKRLMDEHNVVAYRTIGTAACRMAENGEEFVKKVKSNSGIELEVINGYDEAVLNLQGALLNLQQEKAEYVLVYDLGGGSTEITLATHSKKPQILHTISIPWGARNASEKFDLHEFDAQKAGRLAAEIGCYTQKFIHESGLEKYRDRVCFCATSSTPLRLTHLARGWEPYDRSRADGVKIATEDLDAAIAGVQRLSLSEMAENACIGPARAEIFNAAGVIFGKIYHDLGAKEMVVSLKSAVDSMVNDLCERKRHEQNSLCQGHWR